MNCLFGMIWHEIMPLPCRDYPKGHMHGHVWGHMWRKWIGVHLYCNSLGVEDVDEGLEGMRAVLHTGGFQIGDDLD